MKDVVRLFHFEAFYVTFISVQKIEKNLVLSLVLSIELATKNFQACSPKSSILVDAICKSEKTEDTVENENWRPNEIQE